MNKKRLKGHKMKDRRFSRIHRTALTLITINFSMFLSLLLIAVCIITGLLIIAKTNSVDEKIDNFFASLKLEYSKLMATLKEMSEQKSTEEEIKKQIYNFLALANFPGIEGIVSAILTDDKINEIIKMVTTGATNELDKYINLLSTDNIKSIINYYIFSSENIIISYIIYFSFIVYILGIIFSITLQYHKNFVTLLLFIIVCILSLNIFIYILLLFTNLDIKERKKKKIRNINNNKIEIIENKIEVVEINK